MVQASQPVNLLGQRSLQGRQTNRQTRSHVSTQPHKHCLQVYQGRRGVSTARAACRTASQPASQPGTQERTRQHNIDQLPARPSGTAACVHCQYRRLKGPGARLLTVRTMPLLQLQSPLLLSFPAYERSVGRTGTTAVLAQGHCLARSVAQQLLVLPALTLACAIAASLGQSALLLVPTSCAGSIGKYSLAAISVCFQVPRYTCTTQQQWQWQQQQYWWHSRSSTSRKVSWALGERESPSCCPNTTTTTATTTKLGQGHA
jgi:hypothetical protein